MNILLTPIIFLALLTILVIMPILTLISTVFIGRIYYHDKQKPRNAILERTYHSGLSITIVSFLVAWFSVVYLIDWIQGDFLSEHLDFGSVVVATAFVVLEVQPLLNYRSFLRLDGNLKTVQAIPEPPPHLTNEDTFAIIANKSTNGEANEDSHNRGSQLE